MQEDVSISASRIDIEAQLRRILLDPEFERNRSASNFLKFVVDETLEGRGPRLKAFTIALAVLGRDANFDAQNNSIVRVQAARLRQLLQTYYSGPGADDPLRIEMPIGKYQVQFDSRPALATPLEPESATEQLAEPPRAIEDEHTAPVSPARTSLLLWILGGLAAAFAFLWLMLLLRHDGVLPPVATPDATVASTPILTIEQPEGARTPDKVSAFTADLLDSIESRLVAFDTLIVRQTAVGGGQASLVSYSLVVKSAATPDGQIRLGFRLIHRPTGELVWSKDYSEVALTASVRHAISQSVVRGVGDIYGAITSDMLKRVKPWPEKPRGYLCTLSYFDYLKDRTAAKQARTRACLEAETVADPSNTNAMDLLSASLVRDYLDAKPDGHGKEDLSRAARLAQHAFDRDPQRARPNYMLFLTSFYDKRFDEAFAAAQRTLELNPDAGVIAAQIGAGYISRGEYGKGEALILDTEQYGWAPPKFFKGFLALAAYMQNDDIRLRPFAGRPSAEDGSFGLMMKVVSCHKFGDENCAALAHELLQQNFLGIAANIPAALDRYAVTDEIKAKLLAGLREAGYVTPR